MQNEVRPASQEEARRELAGLCAGGSSVVVRGGGCFQGLRGSDPAAAVVFSTLGINRLVFHEPEELIVRAEAGMTLTALASRLADKGQEIPWDLPWPERQTLGGVIAAGIAGPRRSSAGAPRDHVLGLSVILPEGKLIRPGGRVVKNAAGYDLIRLLAGSRGTLGVILETTLLVRPIPEKRWAMRIPFSDWRMALNEAGKMVDCLPAPSFLDLKGAAGEWNILLGFDGPREAVAAAREAACAFAAGRKAEEFPEAEAGKALARWVQDVWDAQGPVFRAGVPRGRASTVLEEMAEFGCLTQVSACGTVRVVGGAVDRERALRIFQRLGAAAERESGWAVQERGPLSAAQALCGLPESTRTYGEAVRRVFDPSDCLSKAGS